MMKWLVRMYRRWRAARWRARYRKYMQSAAWRRKRAQALARAGNRCEFYGPLHKRCKHVTRLECHHLTYKRLGHERLSDLQVLCRGHHALIHGRKA